jgi:hypothetical protein
MATSNKWADLLEEEEELPKPTTSGPDAKGVITKVEYVRNDKGEVLKRTTKTRVIKIEKKVYKVGMPSCTSAPGWLLTYLRAGWLLE